MILVLVGSVLTYKKKYKLRYVMHAGWFSQSVFMSLGFGLTAVVLPTIIVLVEMSQTMNEMSSNKKVLMRSVGSVSPQLLDAFGACMFDNGDLKSYLKINTELKRVSRFFEKFDKLNLSISIN